MPDVLSYFPILNREVADEKKRINATCHGVIGVCGQCQLLGMNPGTSAKVTVEF
jgi:hypothetical protein